MSKTMRTAVVRQFGEPLGIEERVVPVPGPRDVLVRVVASGVCHTDLRAAHGDWPVKPVRTDLDEALAFAAEGKARAQTTVETREKINEVLASLQAGKVDGHVILSLA